MKFTN